MWFAATEEEVRRLEDEGFAHLENRNGAGAVASGEKLVAMRWSGGFELIALGQRLLGDRPAAVVNLFHRELGLCVWTGNPRKLAGLADLGRRGLRFINRQPGSGTRHLIDTGLAAAGVPPAAVTGYRDEVATHWAVGLRVLRGEADAGVASRAVAHAGRSDRGRG